ncbi:MAG: DUF2914 domain-containing protein [Paracoccaceae bacterium]|nr:DUF2914 domain-containing protein [Paracoccaceae bacterium]
MKIKILFTAIAMMLAMSSLHSQTTTSEGAEATPTQAEEQAAEAGRGSVSRATFTTAIVDDEPTDYRSEIENTVPVVYFYAELDGMAGQTAIHRWKFGDKVMADAKIAVKSPRFPAWSSNKMPPESTGLWIVEVLNGKGEVISTHYLNYIPPL